MDERLKRRILLFYVFGIFNALFGFYVFLEGATILEQDTATWLVIFCLTFAAANFYMPYAIKKQWEEAQARRARAGDGAAGKSGGAK